jgi:hypothetical protein
MTSASTTGRCGRNHDYHFGSCNGPAAKRAVGSFDLHVVLFSVATKILNLNEPVAPLRGFFRLIPNVVEVHQLLE